MNAVAKVLVVLLIVAHVAFFAGEALLWLNPAVHGFALPKLNPGVDAPAALQAQVLRTLFINQGVYNLMLALGGAVGLALANRNAAGGVTLVRFVCAFAVGAGVTLGLSTQAYAAAVLQASLGGLAFAATLLRPRQPALSLGAAT
jgi:putative membrane protein